ncbi:MAG: glycosyltransferase [Chitinophagales bacterium]
MSIRNRLATLLKSKPYSLSELLEQLRKVRLNHTYVALCPKPTGGNWLGINNATQQLFTNAFIEVPQLYSNQVLTDKDLQTFCDEIEKLKFENLVLSGYPAYFEKIVNHLSGKLKIGILLHGTFTELGYGPSASFPMSAPMHLLKQKRIQKAAAVRKDVADFIKSHWNLPTYYFMYKCIVDDTFLPEKKEDAGHKKIGVFGVNNFNKNIHNQVCGALLVPNAKVYVGNADNFSYLQSDKIIGVGRHSWRNFVTITGGMDVNLHLSFSESWGQITVESMALGVPCMVSPTTNVLDNDEWLRENLLITHIDSPTKIAEAIQKVLTLDSVDMSRRCKLYVQQLNSQADVLLQEFLNA